MRACAALMMLAAALPARAEVKFEDQSGTLPVAHVYDGGWEHFVGGGVAVFDCNGDARPDMAVAGGTNPAALLVNRTMGSDLAFEAAPLPEAFTGVTGVYPIDIDGDGHVDLAILRVGQNHLLRGLGDCRFEVATDGWGLPADDAWTTAFSATWEVGATWPTLAFGNYVDRHDPEGPFGTCDTHLLVRPAGAGFGEAQVLGPGFCALSMLFSDWSRSGRADLRISNDRHYYLRGGAEQMFDLTRGEWLGARDGWPRLSIWGMGIASRDITGDGRPEVMLTSMGDQVLQLSRADGFEIAPYKMGTTAQRPFVGDDGRPSTGWHAVFADVDNDGLADIFITKGNVDQMPGNATKDPNNLLMQRADSVFEEAALEAGIATVARSRGAALADFDGDGRLDLVVVNRRAPMELYRNVTPGTGAWVAIRPRLDAANRDAVGAWVEVRVAEHVQRQEITIGGGHAGGTLLPLHFGLGMAEEAMLRVIWPDGVASDWTPVTAGRVWSVTPGPARALRLQ